MGILKRLFGPTEPPPPPRDVMVLAAPLARPAAHLVKSADDAPSHLGGAPLLPAGMTWPARDGRPLTFLACLDLPSLHAALPVPWLPPAGRLLFFYDVENQPWGFDPKDRGSWAVIYQTHALQPQTEPFKSRNMAFRAIRSLPSTGRPVVESLSLNTAEAGLLYELHEASYGGEPPHQIGGFPDPVQGDDMELQSQLVSNGVYLGDAKGYHSPLAKSLESGAASWKLLFQIFSDDRLDFMWGDLGLLYFWIREEDARALRFDRAWLIMQCH